MLRIDVTDDDGAKRTMRFWSLVVHVGRGPNNELVLTDSTVSRLHARIEQIEGRWRIVDLGSTLGTRVNGRSIVEPTHVARSDRVQIGPYELVVTNEIGDPLEAELLAAIVDKRDDAGRLVYADWLESQGDMPRAELLRFQETVPVEPPSFPESPARQKLRDLASRVDYEWRMLVARAPIEGCPLDGEPVCPRQWSALDVVDREEPNARACTGCQRTVRYCSSVQVARTSLRFGDRVVIDVVASRSRDDLDDRASPFIHRNPPPPRWRAGNGDDDVDG